MGYDVSNTFAKGNVMASIYVDGSYSLQTCAAAIGVHPHGFARPVTVRNHIQAELLAIFMGLVVAQQHDVIFSDCRTLVECLNRNKLIKNNNKISSLILALLEMKCDVKLNWVKRGRNKLANKLANNARKLK